VEPEFRALLVDYGGVLTNALHHTLGAFCRDIDVDAAHLEEVVRELYGDTKAPGIVTGLETGAVDVADFEAALAQRLRTRDGSPVDPTGLLTRMFAGFRREPAMLDVVRRARESGVRTALVSNSWGTDAYPRDDFDVLFDAVVISGDVGMRKPEPQIYRYAAAQVGVAPEQCVFVDDLAVNVRGAAAVGMCGVHHTDVATTVAELEALFGRTFV
jgi:epoxide hydrolase-like predicted phosphatase